MVDLINHDLFSKPYSKQIIMKNFKIIFLAFICLFVTKIGTAQTPWASNFPTDAIKDVVQKGIYTYVLTGTQLYSSSNLKDFYKQSDLPTCTVPTAASGEHIEDVNKLYAVGNNLYLTRDYFGNRTESAYGQATGTRKLKKQYYWVSTDEGKTWKSLTFSVGSMVGIKGLVYGSSNADGTSGNKYWISEVNSNRLHSSTDGVNFTQATIQGLGNKDLFIINNKLVAAGDKLLIVNGKNVAEVASLPAPPGMKIQYDGRICIYTDYENIQHPDNPTKIIGLGYYIILGDVNNPTSAANKVKTFNFARNAPFYNQKMRGQLTSNHYYTGMFPASVSPSAVHERISLATAGDASRMFQFDAGFELSPAQPLIFFRKANVWYGIDFYSKVYTLNASQMSLVNTADWKVYATGSANPVNYPITPGTPSSVKPTIQTPKPGIKKIGK